MTRNASMEAGTLNPRTVRLIHDLRNELASVRGATHMLSRSPSDPSVAALVIEGIQLHVKQMVALMDDFVREEATPPAAVSIPTPAVDPGSLSMLVADDNADAAKTLAMYLRMQGHRVAVAFDGEAAWQLASADPPDVMLLDITMPNLDGYELATRIRAEPWGRHVHLIAVSGWLSPEQRERALAAGYDAQVNKPIDMDALEAQLRSASTDRRPS